VCVCVCACACPFCLPVKANVSLACHYLQCSHAAGGRDESLQLELWDTVWGVEGHDHPILTGVSAPLPWPTGGPVRVRQRHGVPLP